MTSLGLIPQKIKISMDKCYNRGKCKNVTWGEGEECSGKLSPLRALWQVTVLGDLFSKAVAEGTVQLSGASALHYKNEE